jgi:Protein of unknown function (DUF3606)
MSDNKKLKDKQDPGKVKSSEPYETAYLHRKFPKLANQTVADAVRQYGPERKKIETYLSGLGKAK